MMRLKKLYVDVRSAVFDDRTFVKNNVLHINKRELLTVVADYRFASVDADIALPGEPCRITNVGDIVQPMCKVDDPDGSFPGVAGNMTQAGSGETLVLRGAAVVEVCEVPLPIGTMLDMAGPATEHSRFANTVNIAVIPVPADGIDKDAYLEALNICSKKAARYLAESALGTPPDEAEEFGLDLPEAARRNLEDLPRVAYLFQIFSHAPLTDVTYYGDSCQSMLPILVHPNEILDGALLNRDYYQITNADPSHIYQNHPMILDLYARHGKDLNFAGVVLSNTPHTVTDKQRNAMMASGLVKHHLKADGVIITKEGGGHPQIDIQLNCELCEKMGVRTSILINEFLSTSNASDEVLLFRSEYADAIVTSGCFADLDLPGPDKVIGHTPIPDRLKKGLCDPARGFRHYNRYIRGTMSQLGDTPHTSERF